MVEIFQVWTYGMVMEVADLLEDPAYEKRLRELLILVYLKGFFKYAWIHQHIECSDDLNYKS